jgi:hypothetical protein
VSRWTQAVGTINDQHPATLHGFFAALLFVAAAFFVVPGLMLLVKLPRIERRARALVPGLALLLLGGALIAGGAALL